MRPFVQHPLRVTVLFDGRPLLDGVVIVVERVIRTAFACVMNEIARMEGA